MYDLLTSEDASFDPENVGHLSVLTIGGSAALYTGQDTGNLRSRIDRLPYRDRAWSAVEWTPAIDDYTHLAAGCREVRRVLRPGGTFSLHIPLPEQVEQFWLAAYFPGLIAAVAARTLSRSSVQSAMLSAGFYDLSFVREDATAGEPEEWFFAARNRPSLYLDADYRRRTGYFERFGDDREIADGVARLSHDLSSGRFQTVRRWYDETVGAISRFSAVA